MSTPPPHTTAALARHLGISRWTVSRVLERIHSGGAELPPREFIVHPKLVIRQSTGPACRSEKENGNHERHESSRKSKS